MLKKENQRSQMRAGKIKIQIVGRKVLESRDAGDINKRDRIDWRSQENLGH